MFEKQKMDVTDRVTAKFHDGGMKLYVDKQPIGEVSYGTSGNEYRFEEGYSQENNKFYQYTDVQKQGETQKYTDCDEEAGGVVTGGNCHCFSCFMETIWPKLLFKTVLSCKFLLKNR